MKPIKNFDEKILNGKITLELDASDILPKIVMTERKKRFGEDEETPETFEETTVYTIQQVEMLVDAAKAQETTAKAMVKDATERRKFAEA